MDGRAVGSFAAGKLMFGPDDFRNNPYGHLTNQGSHGGLVGVGLVLLALLILPPLAAWFAAVIAYFVVWEFLVGSSIADGDLAPSWDWRDSIDDTSNVAGGAAVVASAFWWIDPAAFWPAWGHAAACFAIWAGALAFSTWRRTL